MKKRVGFGKAIRKVSVFLFSFALLFSISMLTGCGNGNSGADSDSGKSNSSDNTGSSEEQSGALTTVRLGVMTGSMDHLINIVAQDQGFYEKHGINLEATEFASGIATLDALELGQLDIGFGAEFAVANRFGNIEGTSDMRVFADFAISTITNLYVNPDTIKDLDDIKGKTIVSIPGTAWEYWNATTLSYLGLTSDDVEIVDVESAPNGVALAKKGNVDAFWLTDGENADHIQEAGWTSILNQADTGIKQYQYYVSNKSYLEENNETIKSFLEATQETIDFIHENIDEAAKIVYEKNGLNEQTFKNLAGGYELGINFTQDSKEGLEAVSAWAKENNYFKYDIDINDYINEDAVKELYPDRSF